MILLQFPAHADKFYISASSELPLRWGKRWQPPSLSGLSVRLLGWLSLADRCVARRWICLVLHHFEPRILGNLVRFLLIAFDGSRFYDFRAVIGDLRSTRNRKTGRLNVGLLIRRTVNGFVLHWLERTKASIRSTVKATELGILAIEA